MAVCQPGIHSSGLSARATGLQPELTGRPVECAFSVKRRSPTVPIAKADDRGDRNSCQGDASVRGLAFVIDWARATQSNRGKVPGCQCHRHAAARRPSMVIGDDVMRWFRFSIAGVMVLIVYAAIGFAAFAKVDDPWYGRVLDDAYFMVTVFILATATILAVIRRGHAQAIWVGFAIFGWTHLNYGWPDAGGAPQRARIVTSAQVDGTYRPRFPHMTIIAWKINDYVFSRVSANPLHSDYTWHVLQSTVTMATALIGASFGSLLWKRGERLKATNGVPIASVTPSA